MKYYLLTYKLHDNGHEHYEYITTDGKTEEEARLKGITQQHEMVEPEDEDNMTMFDFGDGETACELHGVWPITKAQVDALDQTGVANFYQL